MFRLTERFLSYMMSFPRSWTCSMAVPELMGSFFHLARVAAKMLSISALTLAVEKAKQLTEDA